MRIGILGGTFNPIHHGHLLMAELVRDKMALHKVVFMPAQCSPFKSPRDLASGRDRLEMIKAAIKGNPHFALSDLEIKRDGPSYTVDTLRMLRKRHPKAELFWIIGEDNAAALPKWREFGAIVEMASFVAVSRLWFNISSSEIRRRVKQGKSIRYMTPERVIDHIQRKRLYERGN